MALNSLGSVPSSLFAPRSALCRLLSRLHAAGSVPDSPESLSHTCLTDVQFSKLGSCQSMPPFWPSSSTCIAPSAPQALGQSPDRLQPLHTNSSSRARRDQDAGSVPPIGLNSRLILLSCV